MSTKNSRKKSTKLGSIFGWQFWWVQDVLWTSAAHQRAACVPTASRCTPFGSGGHSAPHLHAACMATACGCNWFGVSAARTTRTHQNWLNFGWQFWQAQDAFWIRPAHCLLMLFKFQARNQPSKWAQKFNHIWNHIWLNFLWQFGLVQDVFWTRPVHFLLMLFRFLTRNQASKPEIKPQNSRKQIQPHVVEFWMAILAGPGRFLDSACALLADVVQVSSQKSAFKTGKKINNMWLNFGWQFGWVQDACWTRPAHCLLMLFKFQARNQSSNFAQKFNQIWLNCLCQFGLVQDTFWSRPAHFLLTWFKFQARNQPPKLAQKFNQI